MSRDAKNQGVATVIGVVLVFVGAGLLLDRVIAPIFRPLYGMLHAVGYILWPLVFVVAGILLLAGGLSSRGDRRPIAGLYRSRTDRVIGGVLGGVAERFGVESGLVRILFVLFSLLTGVWAGVLFYVLGMVLLPEGQASTWSSSSTAPVPPAPPVPTAAPVTVTPPSVPGE